MCFLLVRATVGAIGKSAITEVARVRFQSRVQNKMVFERLGSFKLPSAIVALVLHLICVD